MDSGHASETKIITSVMDSSVRPTDRPTSAGDVFYLFCRTGSGSKHSKVL